MPFNVSGNKYCLGCSFVISLFLIGLGFKGDIVTVSKRLARNHMFPASVADYVTDENLKKYEDIRKVV